MFSTKRQSSESITETKNVAIWESLITDLSSPEDDDDDFMASDDSDDDELFMDSRADHRAAAAPPPQLFHGEEHVQQKTKNNFPGPSSNRTSSDSTTSDVTAAAAGLSSQAPPRTLESPAYLKDWISHYSREHPPRVNHMGRKMDDIYILKAAQVALSLAKYLQNNRSEDVSSRISCEDIRVDNVMVKNVDSGEAMLDRTNLISSSTGGGAPTGSNTERRQVLALGMILYELFTQGISPPRQIQQAMTSSGSVLSFGTSLRISEANEKDADDDDRMASGGDRRKNKDDDDNNEEEGADDNSAQESYVRKQRRRIGGDEGKEESVLTLLKRAGVPSSISRLISDMLSNRDDADFGGLFQYDKSVSSFDDVIMDLEQMIDQPKDFLYDTVRLSAKPTVRNKLYSRQKELEQGNELAARSAAWYRQDEGFGGERFKDAGGIDGSSSVKQEVLLVSGLPGSGKSSLVNELILQLKRNGWESLHCKFDQIRRGQPLSTIASAFSRLFSSLIDKESHSDGGNDGDDTLKGIRAELLKAFDEESFSILFHLMPDLRRVVSNDDNSADMQIECDEFDESTVISSKVKVHNMFFEILKAISSSRNTPMVLFLDDLHWADSASLELITFIIDEMGANITTDSEAAARGTNVLIIGTVRTNEVEHSGDLAVSLEKIRGCYNVTVTDMALQDLSPADVNVMISEALCYSQRLTRSLASIVYHKSEGNPFYVKEFLNDLTVENLLVYSFSERSWEWDEELIESRTISDGVAEILTRRLLRLPKDQLLGLVMLSCFGSDVSFEVLALVKSSCDNSDIMETLDSIVRARFVERTDEKYRFVHDMILNAAQNALNEDERTNIMEQLLQALLPHGYSDDTILYIVVDLIARVGADRVHNSETRLLYAQLNLTAAKRATNTADFPSALTYVKCGISFLPMGHWQNSYSLSLELFNQCILVEWASGHIEQMAKSLDEVFNNAKAFEDTLRAAMVKLASLRSTGNRLSEAFAYGFQILEQLGETFPATPENGIVVQELLATKELVTGSLNESKLRNLPEMTDVPKKEAMAFLAEMLICGWQSRSIYYPLLSCRMVQITLQYGLAKTSCLGLSAVSLSLVTVFGNFSEGYYMSKSSFQIAGTDKRVLYTMMLTYGVINIWKEPIQAILPQLKDAYNMSLKYGLIDNALAAGMFHAYRAFFTGSLLKPLNTEVSLYVRNNLERHKRMLMHLSVLPISNGIKCLSGSSGPQFVEEFITEEHFLAEALQNKEFTVCESMLAIKMMCSFIFRRLDEIKGMARQYLELFERQSGASAQFVNIYRCFYGGLLSLHFYRESGEQFWMDRAAHAIQKMELWTAESVWNFENKLFLLQAERHYAFGEMDLAAEKYKMAEKSSKKHRFVHEEALTCELAAAFHKEAGDKKFVTELIDRAVECYQTWGAEGKVESILLSP